MDHGGQEKRMLHKESPRSAAVLLQGLASSPRYHHRPHGASLNRIGKVVWLTPPPSAVTAAIVKQESMG